MNEPLPVQKGQKVTDANHRLSELLAKLESDQIEFLDQAGKRLVELSTLMLGLLFGIVGFGDKFPPAYLHSNQANQRMLLAALACYLLALVSGVVSIQPRRYWHYTQNLTENRQVLNRMISFKLWSFRIGTVFLALASFALAWLVAAIVLAA